MTSRSCHFISQLPDSIDVLLEVREVGEQTCNYFKSFHLEIGSFMQKFREWTSGEKVRMFSDIKRRAGNAKISKL